METVRRVTVFVACTSDHSAEVDAVRKAADTVNKLPSSDDVVIRVQHWQADVTPSLNSDAQEAVNVQIGRNWDIFVGILGHRIGTPTARAESGLAEEIRFALEQRGRLPAECIQIYRKTKLPSADDIDIDQLVGVESLLRECSGAGAFVARFSEPSDLANISVIALSKAVCQLASAGGGVGAGGMEVARSGSHESGSDGNEIGILDCQEIGEAAMTRAVAAIEVFVANTEELNEGICEHTERLGLLGPLSSVGDKKKSVNAAAEVMERYVVQSRVAIDEMEINLNQSMEMWSSSIGMSVRDGLGDQADIASFRHVLIESTSRVVIVLQQFEDFRSSVAALPSLTTRLNRAKKQTVEILSRVIGVLESYLESSRSLEAILEEPD